MNKAVTAASATSHPATNASAAGFGLDEFSTRMSAGMIFTGDHATNIAGATSSASNGPQLPDTDPLTFVHHLMDCQHQLFIEKHWPNFK